MKQQFIVSITLLFLITVTSQSSLAAQLEVCASGCKYSTIASAVYFAADGDTIYIHNGTYKESNISFWQSLAFIGESQENVIIDAEKQGRHFRIRNPSIETVSIERMTLINGDTESRANSSSYNDDGRGASIYSSSVDLYINQVTLANNKSPTIGGAIYFGGDGDLEVSKSEFIYNSSDSKGGAIYIVTDRNVSIGDSVFSDNSAQENGGAIYQFSNNFESKQNKYERNISVEYGGAILSWSNKVSFTDDTFTNNKSDEGGAIYAGPNNVLLSEGVDIKRSTFYSNSSARHGVVYSVRAPLRVQNSTFSANTSSRYGSAITSRDSNILSIQSSTFIGNDGHVNFSSAVEILASGSSLILSYPSIFGTTLPRDYQNEIVNSLFLNNNSADCIVNSPIEINGKNNLTDDQSCEPIGRTNNGLGYKNASFSFGSAVRVDTRLADNGGLTKTHKIDKSSNAIGSGTFNCSLPKNTAGVAPVGIAQDQRGEPRDIYCDIGSFEVQ